MKSSSLEKEIKKMTDYELASKFEDVAYLQKINGCLHIFNGRFFEKLDEIYLEEEIMYRLESYLKFMNARKVKDIAFIVKRRRRSETAPGEVDGWRGFENGVWNCFENKFSEFRGTPDSAMPLASITFCLNSIRFPENGLPSLEELGISNTYMENDNNGYERCTIPSSEKFPHISTVPVYNQYHQCPITYPIPVPTAPFISTLQRSGDIRDKYPTPTVDTFFLKISAGNQLLVRRIWEMIGYILAPDVNGKVFFLLQGAPNSGKSVLGRFIEGFFPHDRVTSLDIARLGGQFYPEALFDSALNLSMDLPNKKLPLGAVASLKMMTGKDLMTYEPKYKDARPYRGLCKLLFSTNHQIRLHEWDQAFLDRIVCIPFERSVPINDRDPQLSEKLESERQNVAVKALAYYVALRENNYKFSGHFLPKVDGQPSNSAIVEEFVDACCYFDRSDKGRTYTQDLYNAYKSYCESRSYIPVDSMAEFSRILHNQYGSQISNGRWREGDKNMNGYKGIKLWSIQYDDDGNPHRSMTV